MIWVRWEIIEDEFCAWLSWLSGRLCFLEEVVGVILGFLLPIAVVSIISFYIEKKFPKLKKEHETLYEVSEIILIIICIVLSFAYICGPVLTYLFW